MPNFQLPKALPTLRLPQLVMPRSAAPGDVVGAIAAAETDLIKSLVKEPASALGISLPELPGPASVLAQLLPGQGSKGTATKTETKTEPTRGAAKKFVFE